MPDSLDDLRQIDSSYRATEDKNRRKLVNEATPEWHRLKGLVSRLSVEAKGCEGNRFQWLSSGSQPDSLRLKHVTVRFRQEGKKDDIPSYSVQFATTPPTRGSVELENGSLLAPLGWFLRPVLLDDGGVGWFVCELGQTFSSTELVE